MRRCRRVTGGIPSLEQGMQVVGGKHSQAELLEH